MIITQYKGREVKVAVEVNGVFHYARNSDDMLGRDMVEPLGRDVIKQRILERRAGYKVLVVPYSHWYILEDGQKAGYLRDCLELIINH
jgi:hypothetical protein